MISPVDWVRVTENAQYWIMDGRARQDIDSATCLSIANTFDKAIEDLDLFAHDSCIVKVLDGEKEIVEWDGDEPLF